MLERKEVAKSQVGPMMHKSLLAPRRDLLSWAPKDAAAVTTLRKEAVTSGIDSRNLVTTKATGTPCNFFADTIHGTRPLPESEDEM